MRSKTDASIVRAAKAVGAGEADALVSAGSTGALLAASLFHVKRIRGVHRPAIAVLVPLPGKPVLLLDAGANVDVRPEHLVQFAYMGAAFMEAVHGVARPRVGLLSIGEEAKKGTDDVVAAHEQLARGPLDFAGNVEGTDLAARRRGRGRHGRLHRQRRAQADGGHREDGGGRRPRRDPRRARVDARRAARPRPARRACASSSTRTPRAARSCSGCGGRSVVAHGKSSAEGIANAVRLARRAADENMVERTAAALAEAGALAVRARC